MYTQAERIYEKEHKRKSIFITAAIHALLLLLLFLLKMIPPIPPPEEEGILINFGTSDQGTGTVQPQEVTTDKNTTESNAPRNEQPREQAAVKENQPVKTQDVEEAPRITKEKTKSEVKKDSPRPVEQPKKVEEPKPDPNALYKGKKNQPSQGSSGSEGTTGKPGDMGAPDGDPNSPAHAGSGKGADGLKFDLAGRGWRVKPPIDDRSQETGKVVINIKVDKEGNVISATGPGKGSTTQSLNLYQKSRDAALKAKFSPCLKVDCAEEQNGTITFIFSVE
jgi:outer membrane biosynthesis protein TonB